MIREENLPVIGQESGILKIKLMFFLTAETQDRTMISHFAEFSLG